MHVKLLNEHHLEFLSLKGSCTGSSDSTLVIMSHLWKYQLILHSLHGVSADMLREIWSWCRLFDLERSCGDLRYEIIVFSNGL